MLSVTLNEKKKVKKVKVCHMSNILLDDLSFINLIIRFKRVQAYCSWPELEPKHINITHVFEFLV